jgi:hypothetical protein
VGGGGKGEREGGREEARARMHPLRVHVGAAVCTASHMTCSPTTKKGSSVVAHTCLLEAARPCMICHSRYAKHTTHMKVEYRSYFKAYTRNCDQNYSKGATLSAHIFAHLTKNANEYIVATCSSMQVASHWLLSLNGSSTSIPIS